MWSARLKRLSKAVALVAGTAAAPAQASGCLKGAAIGGVAGHYAGHHGLLGAGVGCVIGGHEAHKRDRERAEQGYGERLLLASDGSSLT
jgi:hypothetical protein